MSVRNKTFGEMVRDLRVKKKMHLSRLAEALNCSVVYVSDIERDRRNPPSFDKIITIAETLGVDPNQLLKLAAQTKKKVELEIDNVDEKRESTALMLARSWKKLEDDEIEEIKKILARRQK